MKSNILLAFRNIIKNRFNSIVTVVGLTIAFACLLLIHLYVSQEKSYNNFHKNRNNIFRINYTYKFADGVKGTDILLDNKLSEIIKEKVPQVSRSTAFRSAYQPTLKFEDSNFEERLCIVDPDFFNMFSFNLVLGNKDEIFKNPDEIVITLRLAEKLQAVKSCTKEELLGKPVFFMDTGNRPFKISGIIEDVPRNSSIRFDALIPFKYEAAFTQSNNDLGNSEIFYEVDKNGNKRLADEQVSRVVTEYYRKLIDRLQSKNILANTTDCFTPFTISLNDVYLGGVHSDYERNGNKKGLYILSAIGFLILIIAGSNFIMLTLAQSFNKAGEVVIRKAMGAGKRNIFNLFFVESAIVSIVSMGLGIYLCFLLLPMFSRLVQAEIYTDLIDIPLVVIFVIACLLIVTLTSLAPVTKTAKIIPTMLASRQMPARNRKGATWMFVSLQYALSIFLIILTISIVRQTNYMKYKSLGFSSDNIISLRLTQIYNKDGITLRDKLKDYSGIINAALTDRNFTGPRSSQFVKNARGENIETRLLTVDQNYISTLDLKLIQGENFKEENIKPEDHSVIINEKLLSHFDFKGNAVGQIINIGGRECNIIGVVKDFHFDSMKEKIQPLALVSSTNMANGYSYLLMKYQPTQLSRLIPYIKKTWKEVAPGKILDFKFWNEQLNQRYEAEERWSRIIGYAALISIIISSLGLLGLTLLLINSCTKEIGIRRVNGAKVSEILTMLNKDFIKWVVVAFVIACPIAWYTIHKWLENFAYKTTLSWWIFALAAGLALGIALLTVSWQSWRAATRNPVEALRYE